MEEASMEGIWKLLVCIGGWMTQCTSLNLLYSSRLSNDSFTFSQSPGFGITIAMYPSLWACININSHIIETLKMTDTVYKIKEEIANTLTTALFSSENETNKKGKPAFSPLQPLICSNYHKHAIIVGRGELIFQKKFMGNLSSKH